LAEHFQQLLHWVNANPGWAGAVVFLMAFAESMAVVGMVVPGVAILFAVGALIGAGALDFWRMAAWAAVGAVLGDGLSFWLGRRYRHRLSRLWPFSRHPEALSRGIAFFEKYGGKSVVIGRFFGPVRAVIPLVAGMMEMPPARFLFANVLSALGWAPAYLLPGMAFGASLELASEVAFRLVLLLVVLVGSFWFLGWLSHRLFLWLQPRGKRWVRKVLQLGERHRWVGRIARALGDPDHPESRGLAMLAGLLVLASGLLALMALLPRRPLLVADSLLHLGLDRLQSDAGNHLMLAVSAMAGSGATLGMLVLLWLLLAGFGLRQASRHWLGGAAFAWAVAFALEYFLRRHPQLLPVFPDFYVLRASVFFGLAAVLAATPVLHTRRWLVYSGATLLLVAVVLAQLYLGSTLPAVLHALGAGLVWVTAVGMAYRTHGKGEALMPRHAVAVGSIVLLLGLGSAFSTPAPPPSPPGAMVRGMVAAQQWRQWARERLPRWRGDAFDKRRYPLNFHYVGRLQRLRRALMERGWRPARAFSGLEWLRLLATSTPLQALPVLPHSHEGRLASRAFQKPLGRDRRLVLYLWPSGYLVGGAPLWLGEVTLQRKRAWAGLLAYPRSEGAGEGELNLLQADLAAGGMRLFRARDGRLLQAQEED